MAPVPKDSMLPRPLGHRVSYTALFLYRRRSRSRQAHLKFSNPDSGNTVVWKAACNIRQLVIPAGYSGLLDHLQGIFQASCRHDIPNVQPDISSTMPQPRTLYPPCSLTTTYSHAQGRLNIRLQTPDSTLW